MIAAIVGSRDGLNWSDVSREIRHLMLDPRFGTVVSGNALGVDRLAQSIALAHGKRVATFPADWEKHGKSAGYKRNLVIVQNCDEVFAFWNGTSKGTKHTIDIAKRMRKPVKIWQNGAWS
jgi:hypothetical protein